MTTEQTSQAIAVRISAEAKEQLDDYARESGRSRKHIADQAITEYVSRFRNTTSTSKR